MWRNNFSKLTSFDPIFQLNHSALSQELDSLTNNCKGSTPMFLHSSEHLWRVALLLQQVLISFLGMCPHSSYHLKDSTKQTMAVAFICCMNSALSSNDTAESIQSNRMKKVIFHFTKEPKGPSQPWKPGSLMPQFYQFLKREEVKRVSGKSSHAVLTSTLASRTGR